MRSYLSKDMHIHIQKKKIPILYVKAASATLGSVKAYESSLVGGVCGQVEACVEQTTDLISRCDEMDKDMASIADIAFQM